MRAPRERSIWYQNYLKESLERAREVAVAEPALDCRELVVAGRSTAGECSNDAGVDPDLLGDMVEHDGGSSSPRRRWRPG